MKTVALPNGKMVPAIGIGTWKMAEDARHRTAELTSIKRAIDLGMTLIDTAEMYGEGSAEELVGEAIRGRREEVFLVSKVYPHNAGRHAAIAACDRSLLRLGVERIDLYLLHWRGSVPLSETFAAFSELLDAGKIGAFGVSNFDVDDMQEAWADPNGRHLATNQILYNLTRRSVEHDLLPWCASHRVPVMAYSPVEQGRLIRKGIPAQTALAWLLNKEGIIAIPKSSDVRHIEENRVAADLVLTTEELAQLDRAFPRPRKPKPLEML